MRRVNRDPSPIVVHLPRPTTGLAGGNPRSARRDLTDPRGHDTERLSVAHYLGSVDQVHPKQCHRKRRGVAHCAAPRPNRTHRPRGRSLLRRQPTRGICGRPKDPTRPALPREVGFVSPSALQGQDRRKVQNDILIRRICGQSSRPSLPIRKTLPTAQRSSRASEPRRSSPGYLSP